MKVRFRWSTATVMVGLFAVSFVAAQSGWIREMGWDVWNYDEYRSELWKEQQRKRELKVEGDLAMRRILIRNQVTQDLIEGRITLDDAMASFDELNSARPELTTLVRYHYPAPTQEGSVRRQVIRHVRETIRDETSPRWKELQAESQRYE